MNATIESLFGPPSEPIDVSSFIQAAAALDPDESLVEPSSAAEECNVDDFRDNLFEAWNNPPLSAHLSNTHDLLLTSLHSTTKTSKSKRKAQPPELNSLPPGVATLQGHLDTVKLTSWKLTTDASTFIRPSKISDQNVLTQVKASREPSSRLSDVKQAIITVTVHNRSTWTSGYINRASQHVLLSSQTLRDLFQVIPCVSSEFPVEETLAGNTPDTTSCVICIENTVYSDGHTEEDYAQKLLKHLQTVSKDAAPLTKAPTTIANTPLSALKLRINQPYWLLHKGNCEHFFVIDQIRLQHIADLQSGYPLTLQITPSLLDLCRACVKVPAALSIIGDIRLGESPCLLCAFCWRNMGNSSDLNVRVEQLPRYEKGW